MLLSQTIRLFLDGLGRSEEYEFYISKFQSGSSSSFLILCPDYDSIASAFDSFHFQLQFLIRLELYPAVLFCGPKSEEMKDFLFHQAGQPEECYSLFYVSSAMEHSEILEASRTAASEKKILILLSDESPFRLLEKNVIKLSERVLFVRIQGALKDESDNDISLYRVKKNLPPLSREDRHMRELSLRLLDLDSTLHLAICSPFQILKEIFTVKGSGSLIRKGSSILHLSEQGDVDMPCLIALLNKSFGRELRSPEVLAGITHFIIEENYRGAILLEKQDFGQYLSKFAVDTEARGEGIAQELWEEIEKADMPIFWRSRAGSYIGRWYSRISSGKYSEKGWTVYWRGVKIEHIPAVIDFCLRRPEDFQSSSASLTR